VCGRMNNCIKGGVGDGDGGEDDEVGGKRRRVAAATAAQGVPASWGSAAP
jgi:hypothetical protein